MEKIIIHSETRAVCGVTVDPDYVLAEGFELVDWKGLNKFVVEKDTVLNPDDASVSTLDSESKEKVLDTVNPQRVIVKNLGTLFESVDKDILVPDSVKALFAELRKLYGV